MDIYQIWKTHLSSYLRIESGNQDLDWIAPETKDNWYRRRALSIFSLCLWENIITAKVRKKKHALYYQYARCTKIIQKTLLPIVWNTAPLRGTVPLRRPVRLSIVPFQTAISKDDNQILAFTFSFPNRQKKKKKKENGSKIPEERGGLRHVRVPHWKECDVSKANIEFNTLGLFRTVYLLGIMHRFYIVFAKNK